MEGKEIVANPSLLDQVNNHIDGHYLKKSAAAETYISKLATTVLDELGFWQLPAEPHTPEEIAQALDLVPERTYALTWLLEQASALPFVASAHSADSRRYVPQSRPETLSETVGNLEGEAFVNTTQMVDYIATRYAEFFRGSRSGPAILLKQPGLGFWEEYFAAENFLYQVHNQLGALGVKEALSRLPRPARILELGSGTGGGTASLLETLQDVPAEKLESLTISDIAPSFLIRILERLETPSHLTVKRKRLDFNRPLKDQGIEPGSFDIILEVNAIHNCDDPAASLMEISEALTDDGWLVLSESVCASGSQVHQDFVFNLLPPTQATLADAEKHNAIPSRFFSANLWRELLDATSLKSELYVNEQGPELAMVALVQKT